MFELAVGPSSALRRGGALNCFAQIPRATWEDLGQPKFVHLERKIAPFYDRSALEIGCRALPHDEDYIGLDQAIRHALGFPIGPCEDKVAVRAAPRPRGARRALIPAKWQLLRTHVHAPSDIEQGISRVDPTAQQLMDLRDGQKLHVLVCKRDGERVFWQHARVKQFAQVPDWAETRAKLTKPDGSARYPNLGARQGIQPDLPALYTDAELNARAGTYPGQPVYTWRSKRSVLNDHLVQVGILQSLLVLGLGEFLPEDAPLGRWGLALVLSVVVGGTLTILQLRQPQN